MGEKITSARTQDITPNASTLIESMRSIGYSLETAIADIIDNSITAQATKINIFAEIVNGQIRIAIIDNGEGMAEEELYEAMRLGSINPLQTRNISDLGRFGLGLKTASLSQCRKLSVVTNKCGKINSAIWDLDHIEKDNQWVVTLPEEPLKISWADQIEGKGTLVLWENFDKFCRQVEATNLERFFTRRMDETRKHLELVFHRFLSGEPGLRKTEILINNLPLEPFDPFNSKHPATIMDPPEKIGINGHEIAIQAYTLPHHSKVSPSEWNHYEGQGGYLKNQGFYVYRGKRLIIHGTWFGLARQKELTKLSRVKIDMPNALDGLWDIDVKKATASPPQPVRERMRSLTERICATSKNVYKGRGKKLTSQNPLPLWSRIQNKNEISYCINQEHPVISNFFSKLTDDLKKEFRCTLELLSSTLPMDALFADLGEKPENVQGKMISDEDLESSICTVFRELTGNGFSPEEIIVTCSMSEPFLSNWNFTERILNRLVRERDVSYD